VDWPAIKKQYAAMLNDCVSRRDLSFIISEMISKLNVGQAYYREGDVEKGPTANVGLMGCRFEAHDAAYRIAQIYRGAAWDTDARNPLDFAAIKVGQYVLAVNGQLLSIKTSPYSPFSDWAD